MYTERGVQYHGRSTLGERRSRRPLAECFEIMEDATGDPECSPSASYLAVSRKK